MTAQLLQNPPPALAAVSQRPLGLDEVARTLAQGRAFLAYQPVIRSGTRCFLAFHEALFRARRANGSVVAAGAVLQIADGTPLVGAIDRFALLQGLTALTGNARLRLSVNMSVESLRDPAWRAIFNTAALHQPDACRRLILEITETTAMTDPGRTAWFMRDIAASGATFALDDFGSGATSLRYLREFSFDILKIDGGFIRGLPGQPDNRALVAAMVAIARHFEMLSVAEFVETGDEARTATELGIDCLQGYHLGKPASQPLAQQVSAPRPVQMAG